MHHGQLPDELPDKLPDELLHGIAVGRQRGVNGNVRARDRMCPDCGALVDIWLCGDMVARLISKISPPPPPPAAAAPPRSGLHHPVSAA